MQDPREAPDAPQALRILALLRGDDVDAAIAAGLPDFRPLAGLTADENRTLAEACERLRAAWAARERHRARAHRLERIAQARTHAREARQVAQAADVATPEGPGVASPGVASPGVPRPAAPSLPPAAEAALARARARVSGGQA